MLTDSEKQWLEQRGCRTRKMPLYVNEYHKSLCMRRKELQRQCADLFNEFEYRTEALADYTEAAFFEAKVAEKLAGITESMMQTIQKDNIIYPCYACPANENCAGFECREALLRYARLVVEEETGC